MYNLDISDRLAIERTLTLIESIIDDLDRITSLDTSDTISTLHGIIEELSDLCDEAD